MAGLEDIYVESEHILAPDRMTRVHGSVKLDRDLRRDLRSLDPFGEKEARREWRRNGMEIKLNPPGKKWCSDHPSIGKPTDEMLEKNPARYWEMLGWVDKAQFTTKHDAADGLHPICNECRARHERERYASMKENEGKKVRTYKRDDGLPQFLTQCS